MNRLTGRDRPSSREGAGDPEFESLVSNPKTHGRSVHIIAVAHHVPSAEEYLIRVAGDEFTPEVE